MSKGTLERPQELSLTGAIFTNIAGASRADPIVKSHFANDVLHFTTQNADNAKDTDDFIMSVNEGQAELSFDVPPDIILEPFPLQREHSQVKVGSGWVPGRAYTTNDSDIENTEMKAIYDEDQRVRQAASIDWGTVSRTDADRRERQPNYWLQALFTPGRITKRLRSFFNMATVLPIICWRTR